MARKGIIHKELTSEEVKQKLIEDIMNDKDNIFMPEPTYKLKVGDKVSIGAIKDAVVDEIIDNGKWYIIDYTDIDHNYGHPIVKPHSKKIWEWYSVRPFNDKETDLIKNKDVRLYFGNETIMGQIHKVVHFGVDFNPEYQRDLVWNDEDREALIDSIFKNIDIGKFAYIENDWRDADTPAYQILDGKQRLTAIIDFYLNKFPYKGLYFNDLSHREQDYFENFTVSVGTAKDMDRAQILKYFLMLNTTGHVVDKKHLQKIEELYEDVLEEENSIEEERE